MQYFLSVLGMIFVLCLPAAAEIKGCYERTYDAGVLKRHPRQLVTGIVLRYGIPPNDQEDFSDDVVFNLRGRKDVELSNYTCKGSTSKLTCKFTESGEGSKAGHGAFVLTETRDGVTLQPLTDLVLAAFDGKKPVTINVMSNPEHKVFTLKKINVGLENCGAL